MNHELKIWPEFFKAVVDGRKRHELRKWDRPFCVGDLILLKEWDPEQFSALCLVAGITREPKEDEPGSWTVARAKATDLAYTGQSICARITYITKPGTWGLPEDVCVLSIGVALPA